MDAGVIGTVVWVASRKSAAPCAGIERVSVPVTVPRPAPDHRSVPAAEPMPRSARFTLTLAVAPSRLNSATYLWFVPGTSAIQTCRVPPDNCRLPLLFWSTASTAALVIRASSAGRFSARLPPHISGDRVIDHSVIRVRCSSAVRPEKRGAPTGPCLASRPIGIMSGSGQAPVARNGVQSRSGSNRALSAGQLSHRSLTIRHMCALAATCVPLASGVGPGERLSTIGRPLRWMASRYPSTSACRYVGAAMSSTLTKSTPQLA